MTATRRAALLLALLFCAHGPAPSWSRAAAASTPQPPASGEASDLAAFIEASYTKYEHRISMRDGKRLHTAVYVPKDRSRSHAILLLRTPYGVAPYGVDRYRERLGPSERFAREGFVFAYQDVRGRFLSEGEFIEMTPHRAGKRGPAEVDESTDAWDTIEWLIDHVPNHNGRVGMWGISYPGFYTAAGMIDAHPALVAASPQAPIADLYMGDDCYHGGAFMLAANFDFFTRFAPHSGPTLPEDRRSFDYGTADGYEFFLELGALARADELHFHHQIPYWSELLEHTTYDEFWRSRAITPHLRRVAPAVLVVGGWYDAENLQGPLAVYASIEERNPGIANHLVMGPWSHGSWSQGPGDRLGHLTFGSATAELYREQIEFPFFHAHLYGDGKTDLPEAWMFETGTNRWRRHDSWPPAETRTRRLFLGPEGSLGFEPLASIGSGASGDAGFDEYTSDPARPVPFLPYTAVGMPDDYMTEDQRFAGRRPDVLVYETEPLEGDLAIAGPIGVELWVSTSGTDSDFVVKLIDAYPVDYPDPDPDDRTPMGGYRQLVRGEPFRAKFRESFTEPTPMTPGEPTRIVFSMPDVSHVFRRGHRVVVQVQSSWFPLVDRNPQTFTHIPQAAPEQFRAATQRVYRSPEMSSAIEIRVLESSM
ncbi:MAG TPA: CocE/NonD family hydrolase [Thermoanaerobaculia bacterium]|nr:CocE/NonD family hydrolase [Thermoanaerobaculia bacterium]